MAIQIVMPTELVESLRRVFDLHAEGEPIVSAMETFEKVSLLHYENPKGDGSDLEIAAKLAGYKIIRTQ